jgi:hypothetical protein
MSPEEQQRRWAEEEAQRRRDQEKATLASVSAELERQLRQIHAESATIQTASLLASVELELMEASVLQEQTLRWTRWGVGVGALAAVGAVVAAVASVVAVLS